METKIELITPKLAQSMLERNTSNRKPSVRVVKRYAAEMLAGDWEVTHQGIAIGQDGRLLDGQHRLMAVAMSGVSVHMLVSRGVPDHQFYIFDAGYGRTDAQNLHIDKRLIEVVKLCIDVARVGRENFGYSPSELLSVAEVFESAHCKLIEYAKTPTRVFGSCPVRAAACCAMLISDVDDDVIAGMYADLVNYRVENFTPSMAGFARLVANGTVKTSCGGGAARKELMARVYPIFSTSSNKAIVRQSKVVSQELHESLKKLLNGRIN